MTHTHIKKKKIMEHWKEILWFLAWPGVIASSYFVVVFCLKKFNLFEEEKKEME